jgi:hypothetical protein
MNGLGVVRHAAGLHMAPAPAPERVTQRFLLP